MARDWPHLPQYNSAEEALPTLPDGWSISQVSELYDQLPVGKRFDQKSTLNSGLVPVIDQSADGIIGWHNEVPGVEANVSAPVITFANHTCEMRVMRRPFSVIQNVFPLVGRRGVCTTLYLYYLTKGRVWLEEYKGHYPDYRRKWVPLPALAEQRAIASILAALDDKIELNRKMSATLEAIARALFKSWFVDFDPVRAKAEGRDPGLPAEITALFPDSFSETAHGQIPSGWENLPLSQVMTFEGGSQPAASEFASEPLDGYVRLVQIRDFYTNAHRTFVPDTARLRKFDSDDIMIARYGSSGASSSDSLGRICRGLSGAYNVALVKVIPKVPIREFLGHFLKSTTFQSAIKGMGARSVQSGFRKEDLSAIDVTIASEEVHKKFERLGEAIWQRDQLLSAESRTLAALRDALLPKLISGELRVGEAERVLAASA